MRKGTKPSTEHDAEMLDEYDFSEGTRGKYAEQYVAGSNVVVLASDVAEVFPTSQAVNEALRTLVRIARQQAKEDSAEVAPRTG